MMPSGREIEVIAKRLDLDDVATIHFPRESRREVVISSSRKQVETTTDYFGPFGITFIRSSGLELMRNNADRRTPDFD